jgi:predicted outer membrane lipoprotein
MFGAIVGVDHNQNRTDLLRGYRRAWYLGVSLAASGIISTMFLALHEHRESIRTKLKLLGRGVVCIFVLFEAPGTFTPAS